MIRRVLIDGFKCIEHLEVTFDKVNFIEGRNQQGKTSIAEAISVCLFGRDLNGSNLLIERLIKHGTKKFVIEVELDSGNLFRRDKTASSTLIQFRKGNDGELHDITQEALDKMLPNYKHFLSVFYNPFFMGMEEADQRDLILSLIDTPDRKELFLRNASEDLLLKHHVSFGDLEKVKKSVSTAKTAAEGNLIKAKSELDLLTKQLKEASAPSDNTVAPDFDLAAYRALDARVALAKERKGAVEAYKTKLEAYKKWKTQTASIRANMANLEKSTKDLPPRPSREGIDMLITQKATLKPVSPNVTNIPKNGKCPTCKQTIPEEDIEDIRRLNRFEEEAAEKVNNQIKHDLAMLKDQIERMEVKYQEELSAWEVERDSQTKISTKLEMYRKQLKDLGEMNAPKEVGEVPDDLEIAAAEAELEQQKPMAEAAEKALTLSESHEAHKSGLEHNIEEKKAETGRHQTTVKELETVYNALKAIPQLETEAIIGVLTSFLGDADLAFQTMEHPKNGGDPKPCFRISDKAGTSYKRFSAGQKIKTNFILQRMIQQLSGVPPIYFIEDADLIDEKPNYQHDIEGQVMATFVHPKQDIFIQTLPAAEEKAVENIFS